MSGSSSLRLRLLAGAAVAVFLALAIAWFMMILLFSRHVERRAEIELKYDAMQLLADLEHSEENAPLIDTPLGDPRFDRPTSGLYWQVSNKYGLDRSRSLWDERLPTPETAHTDAWHTRLAAGPFGQRVLLLERLIQPESGREPVLAQLGYDVRELRVARDQFGHELALFLALLWLVLVAAAWFQVRMGLRPLDGMRQRLYALLEDPGARLAGDSLNEIRPLTHAINQLAEARARDLGRAHRRAADLAHSLKTPLAALSAQSRHAREAGAEKAADGLDRVIDAIALAVAAELSRARVDYIRSRGRFVYCSVRDVAERVVGVVERTEVGSHTVFQVEVEKNLEAAIAADDLTEILGALTENATRYARRRVRISGHGSSAGTSLSVEDDGPGLGDLSAEIALLRGGRLDEAGPAHAGLGLAIVRDLVDATGGQIELKVSPLGGLCVRMFWASDSSATKM